MHLNKKVTHKQSKYFTIMLIPDSSTKVKSLKIPHWFFYCTGAVLAMIIFIVVLSRSQVYHIKSLFDSSNSKLEQTIKQNDQLKGEQNRLKSSFDREKQILETEREKFNEKIQAFEETVDEIQDQINEIDSIKNNIYNKISQIQSKKGAPDVSLASLSSNDSLVPLVAVNTGNSINSFELELMQLKDKLNNDINELHSLDAAASLLKPFVDAYPSIWPISGHTTSDYGTRENPFGGPKSEVHNAIDIAAPTGTEVKASGSGTITFSGYQNGYGNLVIIDHGYGITSYYAHNSKLLVNVGDYVNRGDIISLVGSTGRSTGPHLHFEVRVNNIFENPRNFIEE